MTLSHVPIEPELATKQEVKDWQAAIQRLCAKAYSDGYKAGFEYGVAAAMNTPTVVDATEN